MIVFFVPSFFPRDVLDEILNLSQFLRVFLPTPTCNHRSLKFYQSNRKKEALRMIVSIYNILILSYVKLLFYDLIDKISNSCDVIEILL